MYVQEVAPAEVRNADRAGIAHYLCRMLETASVGMIDEAALRRHAGVLLNLVGASLPRL